MAVTIPVMDIADEIEVALGCTAKFQGVLQDQDGALLLLTTMTKVWLTGKVDVEDDDSEALISLYWPGGGGTTSDVNTIEWKVSRTDTEDLAIRQYDLITDIKGLDTAGDTWRLKRLLITLVPEIHQGVS